MSKLSEMIQWLWLETRLGAPPSMQRTIVPALHYAKEIARLVAKPKMSLYEMKGQNQAGPLTVTFGGLGYAKPVLRSLLFSERPAERKVGTLDVWRPGELLRSTGSDLTIIESSQYLTRKLTSQGAITLPFRVRFSLDVRGEWKDVVQRFRRDAQRNDMRKAKKHGYECEISHDEKDLEMFYYDMYLPTMRKRHGKLAALISRREATQLFRHGWLFLTKRDGIYVSGGLCHAQKGVLAFKEMGVLGGDEKLMGEGAVGAMNYLRIRWANQEGYLGVSLGDCWPYVSGMFLSKRKWGATVSVSPDEHKRIWIGIRRHTRAVSRFFQDNPCVTVDGRGELRGLIVTDNPDDVSPEIKAAWHKRYMTPGLVDLAICSVEDLMHARQS